MADCFTKARATHVKIRQAVHFESVGEDHDLASIAATGPVSVGSRREACKTHAPTPRRLSSSIVAAIYLCWSISASHVQQASKNLG